MTPERRALFMAAAHCQGGHSGTGAAIAEVLGVPFPLSMEALVARCRAEGENPAAIYPWLIEMGATPDRDHRYFTATERTTAREGKAP